jgi:acetyl-CoA acetyltransferase
MDQSQTVIVGIGETTYSSNSGMSTVELLLQASHRAAADAGLKIQDIDGVIIPRQLVDIKPYEFEFYTHANLRFVAYSGMDAGAGVVNAIELAQLALKNRKANYILIYVGDNQATEAKHAAPSKFHLDDKYKRNLEVPMGFFPQPVYFATLTKRYSQIYGNIEEQLAAIAVNTRKHAILNGNAQMKKPMSINDYYNYPILFDPLRIVDCCVVTDGAAAIIVTTAEKAKDLKRPGVNVLGIATAGIDRVSPFFFSQYRDPLETSAVKTAPIAFSQAGITHDDIDVAEIYDSFTINVVLQLEDLGFCAKGEAGDFIGNGERISLNGKLPVNTHGGLLSQGYIYGLNHVVEAVKQIRNEAGLAQVKDARYALVSGFGGWYQGTLILGK